jgi:hypothetical protein
MLRPGARLFMCLTMSKNPATKAPRRILVNRWIRPILTSVGCRAIKLSPAILMASVTSTMF